MTMREYATPRFFQVVYLIRGRLPVPSASCPIMRQVSVNTKAHNLASQFMHSDSPRSESKMVSSKSRALSIIHLFCSRLVSGRYEAYSMSLNQMRDLSVNVKKGNRASFLATLTASRSRQFLSSNPERSSTPRSHSSTSRAGALLAAPSSSPSRPHAPCVAMF